MREHLLNPSHLRQLCEKYGIRPSKKYGQNFLISEKPIEKMIEAAELNKNDTVVEIGPGFGVLTFAVAPLVKKVIAFEIEKKLEEYWDKHQHANTPTRQHNIEIVWGNALRNGKLETGNWGNSYKVLANLPYQITSHALRVLLESENKPERIVVMVQKEVAERICAKPPEMSLLAVSVQYYGEPRIVCNVPRGSFWPEPMVDSAVLAISRIDRVSKISNNTPTRQHGNTFSDGEFFRIVKAGFVHPRKQLWRNLAAGLKIDGEMVAGVLREVCGNEKVRAEGLSVLQWHDVAQNLAFY